MGNKKKREKKDKHKQRRKQNRYHGQSRAKRTGALHSLGFRSYSEYLKSPLWRKIRKQILEEYDWTCRMCGGDASEVHHLEYDRDTLIGKKLSGLMPACSECHRRAEFGKTGKRDVSEARKVSVKRAKWRRYMDSMHRDLDAEMDSAILNDD